MVLEWAIVILASILKIFMELRFLNHQSLLLLIKYYPRSRIGRINLWIRFIQSSFLMAMHFKCNEEEIKVISKAFYTVLGIDQQGKKDVLGLYLSESEGANFWLSVLTDLNNRRVKDFLLLALMGLKTSQKQ